MKKPELQFVQGSGDPAFVIVYLATTLTNEQVPNGSYIFAYNPLTMLCIGSQEMSRFGNWPVAANGDDFMTEKQENVSPNQEFFIGLYNPVLDKFFKLEGETFTYPGNVMSTMKYAPIAMYQLKNVSIGLEIIMATDPDLIAVSLTIDAPSTILEKQTKLVYLKAGGENVTGITMTTSGSGLLVPGKFWQDGLGWCTHRYTISPSDNVVGFTATGVSTFTGEVATATHQLTVDKNYFLPNDKVVCENELFQIVKADGSLYLESKQTYGLKLIWFSSKNEIVEHTRGGSGLLPGDRKLITTDPLTEIALVSIAYMGVAHPNKYLYEDARGSYFSNPEPIGLTVQIAGSTIDIPRYVPPTQPEPPEPTGLIDDTYLKMDVVGENIVATSKNGSIMQMKFVLGRRRINKTFTNNTPIFNAAECVEKGLSAYQLTKNSPRETLIRTDVIYPRGSYDETFDATTSTLPFDPVICQGDYFKAGFIGNKFVVENLSASTKLHFEVFTKTPAALLCSGDINIGTESQIFSKVLITTNYSKGLELRWELYGTDVNGVEDIIIS